MADSKRKRGKADRAKVSSKQEYEVRFVADKFGISRASVRAIIKRVGNSRRKIYAEIRRLMKMLKKK